MHLVSVATSEEDKRSRQRFSKLCKQSMDKLWNDLPQGIVRQLSLMETDKEEASGSEMWEPNFVMRDSTGTLSSLAEAAKGNSQANASEVLKLARLVFLQSMQLEVKGQRAMAAELQCKAMKERALAAESYLSSLEQELQLHKEIVEELQMEKRSLVIENTMLSASSLEDACEKKSPPKVKMAADKLHRDASELLEKLGRRKPKTEQPCERVLLVAPPRPQEALPGRRTVHFPSVAATPSPGWEYDADEKVNHPILSFVRSLESSAYPGPLSGRTRCMVCTRTSSRSRSIQLLDT
eukprot:symbB.v1.2.032443.t1/scaffold3895.1/size70954/10